MEAAAKEKLEGRLGGKRRSIPTDSTAGVSLSGLTQSAGMGTQIDVEPHADSQVRSDTAMEGCTAIEGVVVQDA